MGDLFLIFQSIDNILYGLMLLFTFLCFYLLFCFLYKLVYGRMVALGAQNEHLVEYEKRSLIYKKIILRGEVFWIFLIK
jgi:hypothetical protein